MPTAGGGEPDRGRSAPTGSVLRRGAILIPLIIAACTRIAPHAPTPDANVLLIVIDVLRADHVGSYGYPRDTTPRIDDLAATGVRFETAVSSCGWTRPSMSSLFTSLDPIQHGVLKGFNQDGADFYLDVLDNAYTTWAEILLAAGWDTMGVAPNAYTRPEFGFGQGFSSYVAEAENAGEVVDRFLEWLEPRPAGRFFAYLHFMDVHWPYDPPPPYAEMFGTYPTSIDFDNVDWNELRQLIRAFRARFTEADLEQMIARYDGGTRYVDDEIGRLLDHLAAAGRLDDTLIVVTSDHGEEFMEKGRIGHGRHLYDVLLKVPLVIRFPGHWAAGRVVRDQVRLVDVLPTVLEAVGVPAPGEMSGHSLIGLIETGRPDPEMPGYAFAEHMRSDNLYRQAVRTRRFKFIRSFHPQIATDGGKPGGGEWDQERFFLTLLRPDPDRRHHVLRELYDLQQDPGETDNLLSRRPDLVSRFDQTLDHYMRAREKWVTARSGTRGRIDPDTARELCNLGYIQCDLLEPAPDSGDDRPGGGE
jgi:arylsulfatase A-like enzyme